MEMGSLQVRKERENKGRWILERLEGRSYLLPDLVKVGELVRVLLSILCSTWLGILRVMRMSVFPCFGFGFRADDFQAERSVA